MEAHECYAKSLLVKPYTLTSYEHTRAVDINHVEEADSRRDKEDIGVMLCKVNFNPRRDEEDERPMPIEELQSF